jgi:hypothetical protein
VRMRRAVIALVVVIGLLVVADRVAVVAADHVVATRIQTDQHLSVRPDVSIHGFPFLTQALAGRYGRVTLTVHDLHDTQVRVHTLSVDLHGVHVPLGAVMSQHLSTVPVDRASATIELTYADLNSFLAAKHLAVAKGAGDDIRVSGTATVLGRTVHASGTGRVAVRGSDLVVAVGNGLDVTIPLSGLPFRIALVDAKATNRGIVVHATASGLVLHPRT